MEVREQRYEDGVLAEPGPAHPEYVSARRGELVWTWVVRAADSDGDELLPLLHARTGVEQAAARVLLHGRGRGIRRPTLRRQGDTVALSLRVLGYDEETDAVESEEEWFVCRGNDVISLRRASEGISLSHPSEALESSVPEQPPRSVTDVLHEVLLRVTADYEDVHAELENDVDEVETSVFSPTRTAHAQRIYLIKREVAETRRAVTPLVELLVRDLPNDPALAVWSEHPGAHDVMERLHRLSEGVEALDELLSSILAAHVARVSSQQNNDMRRISAGAALIVVPTLLAGVWGMNFDAMPELEWRWGYPMALGTMALSVLALWRAFRRSGWF